MSFKPVFIFFLAAGLAACKSKATQPKPSSNLAKVLITDFYNKSENPNHDYLVSSLTSAVETAMSEKFSYQKHETTNADLLRKTLLSEKNLNERLQATAKENAADFLIFGWFEAASKNKILIKTVAYVPENEEIISQFEKEIAVDSRIFETINTIAQSSVGGIRAYTAKIRAQEGQKAAGDNERIELTKRALGIHVFVPPIF